MCSPLNVKLAEIRSGVSRPDRQREDCFFLEAFPRDPAQGQAQFFFSLSLSELLKPISWAWNEVRWGGGLPGCTRFTVYTDPHTCT